MLLGRVEGPFVWAQQLRASAMQIGNLEAPRKPDELLCKEDNLSELETPRPCESKFVKCRGKRENLIKHHKTSSKWLLKDMV